MKRRWIGGVLVLAIAFSLPGCSGWSRGAKGATIGGVAGAGLGALVGSAVGSWGWGAVIGAAGGALAGYIIAEATADDGPPPVSSAPAPPADSPRVQSDRYFDQARHSRSASESEYLLKRSIELHPTAAAYNNLGLVYLQNGDRRQAEECWKKALELDPTYRPAIDNLAKARSS